MQADNFSLFVMGASLALLLLLLMKFKLHPVFALLLVAIASAIGFGFPLDTVVKTVTTGFGGTIASIGVVIILGCTIGVILEDTGGALVIAKTIFTRVGQKHAAVSMAMTGYLVSIPVFSDSVIIMLSPIVRSLSAQSGAPLVSLLGGLNAGVISTHTMVPPTPGPLAVAGTLGVDVGLIIGLGLIPAAAYTIAGTLWCNSKFMLKRFPMVCQLPKSDKDPAGNVDLQGEGQHLPNAALAFSCLLLPVLLICMSSFAKISLSPDTFFLPVLTFLGDPVIALFLGVFLCLFLDPKRATRTQFMRWCDKAVESSGFIAFATGAAGSYGAVLKLSGVGAYLGELIAGTPLPPIFVPYLVAILLSTSNGSATVSMLTGSAIILPLVPALGLHPAIAGLAICAGSSFSYHTNSSYFWAVVRTNSLPLNMGFGLVTASSAIGSLAAFAAVCVLSLFITP